MRDEATAVLEMQPRNVANVERGQSHRSKLMHRVLRLALALRDD